jgi:hypothetical protein
MSDNRPLVCDLTAINDDERAIHKEIGEKIFTAVKQWRELPNGYALRIPTESGMIEKAGTFIARERRCCPFFRFHLEVTPEEGPVWLKLTGDQKVKRFIKQNVISRLNLKSGN